MGGDGGSTALERKYLRGSKESSTAKDSKNTVYTRMVRAQSCALSNQPLQAPICVCEMGYLYNKEALLTALLDSNSSGDKSGISKSKEFQHVTRMKDVKEAKFYTNPQFLHTKNQTSNVNASSSMIETTTSLAASEGPSPFSCPITGTEFNGKHPFVMIWTTGYIISEKALRELGHDALQAEYGPFNKTVLLPKAAINDTNTTSAGTNGGISSNHEEDKKQEHTLNDIIRLLPESTEERTSAAENMYLRRAVVNILKAAAVHKQPKKTTKGNNKRKHHTTTEDNTVLLDEVNRVTNPKKKAHVLATGASATATGANSISAHSITNNTLTSLSSAHAIAIAAMANTGLSSGTASALKGTGEASSDASTTYKSLFHGAQAAKPTDNELFNQARGRGL